MRDLMRASLARSLRTLSAEDRLSAALPVVCGSAMAAHCTVERLDEEGTLHLRVRGEWLNPLLGMREVLRHDLARISGVALEHLHFEAEPGTGARRERTATGAAAKAERVSERTQQRRLTR